MAGEDFPDDADGNLLRHLAARGFDLTRQREIEFYCFAADDAVAARIATVLSQLGYACEVTDDPEAEDPATQFSVYARIQMIPRYDDLVERQRALNEVLEEFDTNCDGWATSIHPTEQALLKDR